MSKRTMPAFTRMLLAISKEVPHQEALPALIAAFVCIAEANPCCAQDAARQARMADAILSQVPPLGDSHIH